MRNRRDDMEDDKWAEAYSKLLSALENAFEIGMTEEEIEECVENARPSDKPYVPGPPKPKRKPV
jgi:hypothetical protein